MNEGPTSFFDPAVARHATPREWVLAVPGDPVPWQAAVKVSSSPKAPRKVPDRQSRHASAIVTAWERTAQDVWLEKGTAVEIDCEFYVTRPKSTHYGSGRNERTLKPAFENAHPTGRPDLSNLVKMVEDALTGVVWKDDDQVVSIRAHKTYIAWWEQPRSVIRIRRLP